MTAPVAAYRFVGAYSIIHDAAELKEVGQQVMLTDEQAETALAGGCMIVPEADFLRVFTLAELKDPSFPKKPGQWTNAALPLRAKRELLVRTAQAAHKAALERAAQREAEHHTECRARIEAERATSAEDQRAKLDAEVARLESELFAGSIEPKEIEVNG